MEKSTEKGSSAVVSRPHDHQDMGVEGLIGNSSVRTTETLLRIVPMGFCVTAMVMMLKNSQTNDFGSSLLLGSRRFQVLGLCERGLRRLFLSVGVLYRYESPFYHVSNLDLLLLRPGDPSAAKTAAMTYVILAAGAVSAEVLYLAKNGDTAITWSEACGVFDIFCRKAKMSTVITFATMICYAVLSLLSSYRLFSNYDAPISYPCKNKGTEMPVFAA
ncbi:hypothetical protein Sjap_020058 [Stephania japonica]|uniref:CASP-like protein n=1 Tax=Stephania japonica TaxID=461633 RepID=A0AAP0F8Y8_9MAGN